MDLPPHTQHCSANCTHTDNPNPNTNSTQNTPRRSHAETDWIRPDVCAERDPDVEDSLWGAVWEEAGNASGGDREGGAECVSDPAEGRDGGECGGRDGVVDEEEGCERHAGDGGLRDRAPVSGARLVLGAVSAREAPEVVDEGVEGEPGLAGEGAVVVEESVRGERWLWPVGRWREEREERESRTHGARSKAQKGGEQEALLFGWSGCISEVSHAPAPHPKRENRVAPALSSCIKLF